VASSGKPSKNFKVPRRVSTLSGVTIESGIGVVIFILGASAAAPPRQIRTAIVVAQSSLDVVFID
jgi:hypothetical protein